MKTFGLYALVAAAVICGVSVRLHWRPKDEGALVLATGSGVAALASELPLSPLERQASRGITGRVGLVRDEIARVASGDQVLAREILAIAQAVQQIDQDDEELRREAERSRGLSVAVVQSGSSWVAKR